MRFIIVIKGVTAIQYTSITKDIAEQFNLKGWSAPIFAHLPSDYQEIEIVWIDEQMERDQFSEALKQGLESLRQSVKLRGE